MNRKLRIGIDVGGTFTDAVAMDNETYEVVGLRKIHTTHSDPRGVTAGVIRILQELLSDINAEAEDVIFIAHGTTQATNALLEGDVSPIGIIGIGNGVSGVKTRVDTDLHDIPLFDDKSIHTEYSYLNYGSELNHTDAKAILDSFRDKGLNVIVLAEAFSVDNPDHENSLAEYATSKYNMLCTCTNEISKLYGLKARTKTAAINACILPKMIQTADMTSEAVKDASIKAPLMIMRSDGGVMHVNEIKKRPILTVLSGPAAGVAGALMYERISDGVFLEVGGTSTDISAIRNGKVQTKYANIGGHSTYVTSLDINTIGIAGGSMVYCEDKRISAVGPRSSHIAGMEYACFQTIEKLEGAELYSVIPTSHDKSKVLALRCKDGTSVSVTLTCAANFMGLISEDDYARADPSVVRYEFELLSKYLGLPAESIATQILDLAVAKVIPAVTDFIKQYGMDNHFTTLCGGGGGASAVVPYLSKKMNLPFKIVKNAPYISTIGAALAMVRDVVERTIVNPSEDDLLRIREEALQSVVKSGASEETVSIDVEIDSTKNIVRAVAVGAVDINSGKDLGAKRTPEEVRDFLERQYKCTSQDIVESFDIGDFRGYEVSIKERLFFGLIRKNKRVLNIVDVYGTIRLSFSDAEFFMVEDLENLKAISDGIDSASTYDESGKVIPDVFVLMGSKILSLDGIQTVEQVMAILGSELKRFGGKRIGVVLKKR